MRNITSWEKVLPLQHIDLLNWSKILFSHNEGVWVIGIYQSMNCSIPQLTWLTSILTFSLLTMESDRDERETERGWEREDQEVKREEKEK